MLLTPMADPWQRWLDLFMFYRLGFERGVQNRLAEPKCLERSPDVVVEYRRGIADGHKARREALSEALSRLAPDMSLNDWDPAPEEGV